MCGVNEARIYDPNPPAPEQSILEKTLPPQPGDAQSQQARFNAILRQRMNGSRLASFLGSNITEGHRVEGRLLGGQAPSPVGDVKPFAPFAVVKRPGGNGQTSDRAKGMSFLGDL